MPLTPNENVASRRHHEWKRWQNRWRWLLDSYEGGDVYRTAVYGTDVRGQDVRNLVRHKREYPDPRDNNGVTSTYNQITPVGADPVWAATDDDYTLRWARTPVPTILSERVESHLAAVYAREVERETEDARLKEWWADVDGNGTTIDEWMSETIAPLLMVLGCIDIYVDHPKAPEGVEINTVADQRAHRLDRCVASYVLPDNVVWWELDAAGQDYVECQVRETDTDGNYVYRVWTAEKWTLYDETGSEIGSQPHPFGRVPIKRIFDRRRYRTGHVGASRYEAIAELQREFYNRDSELILSDTTQAHPLLQGPEDYVQADGSVPIGPSWLLPKKKNNTGGSVSYEAFEVLDFPKDGAESIRQNCQNLVDRADRAALLTKPAGAQGTTGQTVSQSGVSKRLDQSGGNNLLAKIAGTLQRAEKVVNDLACLVLGVEGVEFEVRYPRTFDLFAPDEYASGVAEFQAVLASAGSAPEAEGKMLCRLVRLLLPGLEDDEYEEIDAEIEMYLEAKAAEAAQMREAGAAAETGDVTHGTDGSTNPDAGDGGSPNDGNLDAPDSADPAQPPANPADE